MPLMLTLTYADPHLFSMFMAMVAVAATATATVVAVAKSESSTPTSSCQQSQDTSSTKSRISVEDRVSLEKVASSPIPLAKTTAATTITATRPKTTTPPARTSWAQNNNNNIIIISNINSPIMTRCNQNHTIVSDHHQHRHEHPANDHATAANIIEDHPHDILTQGIPEYFRFADPTGVYGILDEMDILTQRMENYPINLILAPGTLEKILSRNIYPTQCNDQANSEPDNHRVLELITRSPSPILAF
ncbi:hypothetical protein TCAL_06077 [Tigriopus californicus]|uniref:Uncharacterized protein n=2 Tax=Tigriopus californicus TaxID=6832 RepID=A0A553P4W4_TIGCA|nr:hypothetical protein TCAL_06077 [Tigriopus californicus]